MERKSEKRVKNKREYAIVCGSIKLDLENLKRTRKEYKLENPGALIKQIQKDFQTKPISLNLIFARPARD